MLSGYSYQQWKKEKNITQFLLFKQLTQILGLKLINNILPLLKISFTEPDIKQKEFYILFLAVYPTYRRQGIGTQLLLNTEKKAARKHNTTVLIVKSNNHIAQKFYKNLGYTIEKKTPTFKINGKQIQLYKMSKNLS